MLNVLKRYSKIKKPFYGINCGTFGFLMNRYVSKNIEKKIIKARWVSITPLELITVGKNNK